MRLSTEVLLVLLIVALYLHDSVHLLREREVVLLSPWGRRWLPAFGSRFVTFRSKGLALLPALVPASPCFRLTWSVDGDLQPAAQTWDAAVRDVRGIQAASALIFVLVVLVFPWAVLARAGDLVLLLLVAAIYCSLFAVLAMVWRRRARLGLGGRAVAMLAVELLLCPPMGANAARRACAALVPPEDFILAAKRLLPAEERIAVSMELRQRMLDVFDMEEDATPARRQQLVARAEAVL